MVVRVGKRVGRFVVVVAVPPGACAKVAEVPIQASGSRCRGVSATMGSGHYVPPQSTPYLQSACQLKGLSQTVTNP